MKKLLSILGFVALTSTPFISPLQLSTNTEILTNKDDYQLIELERQNGVIATFADYNNELYIGMWSGYLSKMNLDGKVTEILGKDNTIITSMKEFNGELYFVKYGAKTTMWKILANGEIIQVLNTVGTLDSIKYLQVFNNELYFVYQSASTSFNALGKINANGEVRQVLAFDHGSAIREMKVFDNNLYFVTGTDKKSIISIMDRNGQLKKVQETSFWIQHSIVYNQELYFSLTNGSLIKLDANNEIKIIVERSINTSSINTLSIFRNELYLANGKKIEKLTKDNKIETVVEVKQGINDLGVFNNELYIGMMSGYFAKLI